MGLFNKMTFWDALQLLDCDYLSPHLKKKIIKAESNFTEEEKTACYIMYSLHKGDCGLALSFINRAEHGEELIPEIMMALFTHVAVRTFRAAYEKEPSNPDYIAFFAFAYEIGFYDCEKDHAKAVEFADLLRFTDTDGVLVKYALKKIFPEETHNGSTADDNDRKNATANTDPTSTAVPTSAKDPSDKSAPQAEFKRVEYDGGDVYEGEILNGKRHGKGKYTWSDGSFYEGEWKDDRKDGNGKQSHPDGSCYDGGWKDDKMDGFGVLVYSNQSRYEGHWSEGYENGHGMLTFANGNSYDGEWKDGNENGHGIRKYINVGVYDGEWKDGDENGHGIMKYINGDVYDGEWKDGNENGHGTMTYANGDRYDGEWKDGHENGHGMLTFANGNSYDGDWVNGEMNGNGIYTYANGEKYKVTCKEDEIISKEPFETPKTSSTVIRSNQKAKTEYKQIRYDGGDVGEKSMSICDELKKQAEQTYAEGIDKSIETAAACFRLCAEGLSRFPDDGGGSYPIQDISLLIACSAVSGGWNRTGSADRDRMSERLKLYVSNVNELCDDLPLALTVPGFANIGRNLMSSPQISAFTEHLTRLFQTLDEHEKMAVVTMHYLMLYAVFEQWPQVDVLKDAYENALVQPEEAYESPESNTAEDFEWEEFSSVGELHEKLLRPELFRDPLDRYLLNSCMYMEPFVDEFHEEFAGGDYAETKEIIAEILGVESGELTESIELRIDFIRGFTEKEYLLAAMYSLVYDERTDLAPYLANLACYLWTYTRDGDYLDPLLDLFRISGEYDDDDSTWLCAILRLQENGNINDPLKPNDDGSFDDQFADFDDVFGDLLDKGYLPGSDGKMYLSDSDDNGGDETEESDTGDNVLLRYQNGDSYRGAAVGGVREGFGAYFFADGGFYRGYFHADSYEGYGMLDEGNGRVYKGLWKDDKRCGYGEQTFESGSKYFGWWKDDCFQGFGCMTLSGGEVYVGEYENDKENGIFLYNWGNKWSGYKAADGKVIGSSAGRWTAYKDGSEYCGPIIERRRGNTIYRVKEGFGEYRFPDDDSECPSDRYLGQFKDDMPYGTGIRLYTSPETDMPIIMASDDFRGDIIPRGHFQSVCGIKDPSGNCDFFLYYVGECKDSVCYGRGVMYVIGTTERSRYTPYGVKGGSIIYCDTFREHPDGPATVINRYEEELHGRFVDGMFEQYK